MRRLSSLAVVGAGLLALGLVFSNRGGAALAGSTVTGKIKFVGKAPANPAIDMSEEPKCKEKYTTTPREQIVAVNKNGTLANVFVYVKSGLPAGAKYPVPATPVELDQQGCMYHPRTFGIMVGQKLDIKNSDPVLHNIKAMPKKNRRFNISQPSAGMKTTRTFTARRVPLAVECNVHGWMHAHVGRVAASVLRVLGRRWQLQHHRAPGRHVHDRSVAREVRHQTATVTVTGSDTKTADFTFTAKLGRRSMHWWLPPQGVDLRCTDRLSVLFGSWSSPGSRSCSSRWACLVHLRVPGAPGAQGLLHSRQHQSRDRSGPPFRRSRRHPGHRQQRALGEQSRAATASRPTPTPLGSTRSSSSGGLAIRALTASLAPSPRRTSRRDPTGVDRKDPASLDDIVIRNQLHLPVGRPVVAIMTAEDVIHSFFVPEFRVKQDVVPGTRDQVLVPGDRHRAVRARLRASSAGSGTTGCGRMVTVHTQEDFDAWLQKTAKDKQTADADQGEPTS